jgi:pyruvate/2-oxoglutarate dehydrogenase complex dihydrolipoamide dehydrogenase (E3) component
VAAAVAQVFAADGITVRLGSRVTEVARGDDGTIALDLGGGERFVADELLVATGRAPVTDALGLDAAGVATDERGFVVVDERLATTAPHTWAAGDVAGTPQFTHASLDDYRVIKVNLAGGRATTSGRLLPYAVFTDPELARVGMTERQARDAGHRVRVARLPVAAIPRARTMRRTTGLWHAVVDAADARILGATLFGPAAGEVITTIQIAILAGLPYPALRDGIIAHPTMTEGLNMLFGTLEP